MSTRAISAAPAKARRSQEERSAASRASLIESAIRHLRERGLAQTNMTAIAADAKLTRGAIQHHFSSRDQLILAVISELDDRICQALEQYSLTDDMVGIERLHAMVDHVIRLTASEDAVAVYDLWSASRNSPELREKTLELQRELTARFGAFWRRNLEGQLPSPLIEASLSVTTMLSQGAAMSQMLSHPPEKIATALFEGKRVLMEYVQAHS